jgi:acid phosphatase (class B)
MRTLPVVLVLLLLSTFGVSAEKTTSIRRATFATNCTSLTDAKVKHNLRIVSVNGIFEISDKTKDGKELFRVSDQRPSLNVRVEDGTSEVVNEFVDFNDKGLEFIPVDGKKKLEIDLGPGPTLLTFAQDETSTLQLNCEINRNKLLNYLGIKPVKEINFGKIQSVGFDIDDTLLFSTPTFDRAILTGGLPKPTDELFWSEANACDMGCAEKSITLPDGSQKTLAANSASGLKAKAVELLKKHRSLGHKVFAITGRPDIKGDPLRDYLVAQMGFKRDEIFFEPDIDVPGNPAGKSDRIESLNLDLYYGDSDSDITDAMNAFVDSTTGIRKKTVKTVRFFRSPKSNNRKAGRLNKYHPGYFGEPILEGTY